MITRVTEKRAEELILQGISRASQVALRVRINEEEKGDG